MKESKAMMKKEVSFMKKKGAPKSMIRHEEAEYGMKKGVKKMQLGGMASRDASAPSLREIPIPTGIRSDGMRQAQSGAGGAGMRRMAKGGSTGGSYRRAADGIASKGKTKGKIVRMNYGGKC